MDLGERHSAETKEIVFNCRVLPATKSLMLGKLLNLPAVCFLMAVIMFSLPESG